MQYRKRNRHDPRGGCAGEDEWYWDYWNVCCYEDKTTHFLTVEGEGVYTAQNNFGDYWGMSGFMMIAAEDGDGFSGMNRNVERLLLKEINV